MVRVNVIGGKVAWKRRQIRQAFGKLVQPTIRVVHAVLPVSRSKVPLEVIGDRKPRGGGTLREGLGRLGIKLNRRWCHRHSRIVKGLLMPLILSSKTTPVQPIARISHQRIDRDEIEDWGESSNPWGRAAMGK